MPDRIILPDLTDDENDLLGHLLEQLNARLQRNWLRASYYDGKRVMRQIGTVIPPQYYRLGLVLGWSAKGVDALARRCNLTGFIWPDGDLDSLGGSEVWDGNMLGSEVDQAVTSSLIHGPAFAITTRGGPSEPPALIHFKDATDATGDWNTRTRSLDNLLSIIDRDKDGEPTELALYLRGDTITGVKRDGKWESERSLHPWGVPADVLPYKPRLKRPFGSSRITRPVMGWQDAATRSAIRLEGHMDVYSFPEMVMMGADMSIFRNPDGSLKPDWQVMLGRWKGIPDDEDAENPRADVKQFPAQSPQPHLAAINAYAKLMGRELSLPDTALAITDVANPTSAESYDASQYELIAESEGATDDWSPGLRRTKMRALAIANGLDEVPAAWKSIDANWRDPRYQSRAAEADAGAKQLATVPWLAETEVGLELLGLNSQQIKRALSDRRRQGGSAALRAIQAAVEQQRPVVTTDANGSAGATSPA